MCDADLEFQEIHDVFRPKIYRYLSRMVGENEAEDLTQEVFIKVNQGLRNFRGESKLSTWLNRIATNAAVDRLRSPSFQRAIQQKSYPANPIRTTKLIAQKKALLTAKSSRQLSKI